jgi:hypothetical protein
MENIVIELSRYTANEKPSPAQWTNIISKPIKIQQGDSIMVKQCFIDTRLIDQQSILIEQDVEWTLQFSYYILCHGINQNTTEIDPSTQLPKFKGPIVPDGNPYILSTYYNPNLDTLSQSAYPLIDSKKIIIPAGTYERSFLATFITKQMQTIRQPQNVPINNICFTSGQNMPIFDASFNCTGFTTPFRPPTDMTKSITPFFKPLYSGLKVAINPTNPAILLYYDGQGEYRPASYFRMCDNTNYLYPDGYFVTATSGSNVGSLTIDGQEYALFDGGMCGASQMSLTYNDNNSNKFAMQYMHSPLINSGNECVGTYITNEQTGQSSDNIIQWLDSYSGIILCNTFTNLSDDPTNDPFFKQLGFNYDDLVSPDIKNLWKFNPNGDILYTGTMDYANFIKYTTRNFYPLSALSDINTTSTINNYKMTSYASILSTTTGYDFQNSNITDEIFATEVPISSTTSAGHFELELICGYNTEYISQQRDYNIKEIIGNYFYTSDSFSMTLGPSSIIYTHVGVPITLQSLTCRILNPVTKELEQNLGNNSTIYLQIVKEPKKEPQDTKTEEIKK